MRRDQSRDSFHSFGPLQSHEHEIENIAFAIHDREDTIRQAGSTLLRITINASMKTVMKSSVALTLLLACSASAAPPAQVSVPIELGPKAYRNGDAIEITEVTATSPLLEQGDSVTVTGRSD